MIPLLINVEVTGKGARKAELYTHAGDTLVRGKGPDEPPSKAPLSPLPATRAHFALVAENLEDFGKVGVGWGAREGCEHSASSVWECSFLYLA